MIDTNTDTNNGPSLARSFPYGGIRALVVEDDRLAGKWLRHELENKNASCEIAESYDKAEEMLNRGEDFDLFLLDFTLGLGSRTGLDLCRVIRSKSSAPIIFISGNRNPDVVASCLEAGADHFLQKPIHSDILTGHVNSALRRVYGDGRKNGVSPPKHPGPLLDISLDEGTNLLCCEDRVAALTKREMVVMDVLIMGFSHLVSREEMIFLTNSVVMKMNARYLDNLVSRIRKKLASVTSKYEILTVRSLGYALVQKNGANDNTDDPQ